MCVPRHEAHALSQAPHIDLTELRGALVDRIESLAENLLGPHNRSRSRRTQWRWGAHGSFSLELSGQKRGLWRDHEAGRGGSALELIRHIRGGSFSDALAWGAQFAGIHVQERSNDPTQAAQEAAREAERRAEQERRQVEQEAGDAADKQRRIEWAQSLWARSEPLPELAERYLIPIRGIPKPAAGWPASIRWLPDKTYTWRSEGPDGRIIARTLATAGAIILASTLPDGTLQGGQRVYLAPDGDALRDPEGIKVKRSHGVPSGAAARFPGPPDGPLLLAEGPETALSVWAATGHETWAACGSLSNLRPERGRVVVLCRDDDPEHSPADKGLRRTVDRWRGEGVEVRVATPGLSGGAISRTSTIRSAPPAPKRCEHASRPCSTRRRRSRQQGCLWRKSAVPSPKV